MKSADLIDRWDETLETAQKRLEYVSWGMINAVGNCDMSREIARMLPQLESIIGALEGFRKVLK